MNLPLQRHMREKPNLWESISSASNLQGNAARSGAFSRLLAGLTADVENNQTSKFLPLAAENDLSLDRSQARRDAIAAALQGIDGKFRDAYRQESAWIIALKKSPNFFKP